MGANELVFRVRLDGAGRIVADLNNIEQKVKSVSAAGTSGSSGAKEIASDLDKLARKAGELRSVEHAVNDLANAGAGGASGARSLLSDMLNLLHGINSLNAGAQKMSNFLTTVLGFGAAGTVLGSIVQAIEALGKAMLDTQVNADKLRFTLAYVGGAAGAAKDLDYLRNTANRLGLDFKSAAMSYARFAAANKENGLSADVTRQTFEGLSKAMLTFGLSAEESNGVMLALWQMVSKGTVSAEELKGQIGERLPGAFAIAARAMGVSTAELQKMLETGKLATSDFLPRFAQALNDTFTTPIDTAQANINRLSTAWETFKQSLFAGNSTGMFSWLTNGLNESAAAMRRLGADANVVLRTLAAIGGFNAGALGFNKFDLQTKQKRLMMEELPDVKRQIDALEAKKQESVFNRLNLLEEGKLNDLKRRASGIRSELMDLSVAIGRETGFKAPDLKGDLEASRAKAGDRLKAYLDDMGNESKKVKIAQAIEEENKAFEKATSGFDKASKQYIAALEAHERRVGAIKERDKAPKGKHPKQKGDDPDEVWRQGLLRMQREADVDFRNVEKSLREMAAMRDVVDKLDEKYAQQQLTLDGKRLDGPQRELADALRQVQHAADAARDSLAAKARTLADDDLPALESFRLAMIGVDAAEAAQIASVREHFVEQERLNSLWETGAIRALEKFKNSGQNVAEETRSAFEKAFTGIENALMNFLETGKLSFSSFAKSLIADMARIELRALASKLGGGGSSGSGLAGIAGQVLDWFGLGRSFGTNGTTNAFMTNGVALKSARGNVFEGSPSLHRYANTVQSQPTFFAFNRLQRFAAGGVFGEAGPEAVMPLTRDAQGRLGVRSSGGALAITVNVPPGSQAGDLRRAAGSVAREVAAAVQRAQRFT